MSTGAGAAVTRWAAIALIAGLSPVVAHASDPSSRGAIRQELLGRINADRTAHGLAPVRLDPALSSPADAYCERQIAERTVGHFATDGLAPYARYSQAGVNDGIAENAVAWSAQYAFSSPGVIDLARRSHDAMMAETPPDDSHRRTILDPHATHVAIGSAWEGNEFRLVQIFIRRYIEWTAPPPRTVRAGDRLRASGRAPKGWDVTGASIHWEPLPRPLLPAHANRIETYSLPPAAFELPARRNARTALKPTLSEWAATAGAGQLLLSGAGGFSLAAPLDRGAGIYTLVVWLRGAASGERVAAATISTIATDAAAGTNDAPAGR